MKSGEFPLVSIITPVFNGEKYLDALIQSVQEQDYPNIEHIIIDDGSTDGGTTTGLLSKYPHLRWWTRPNKGQYATMNEGLQEARGEMVVFICADDVLLPGAVKAAVDELTRNPEWEGVYGEIGYIDENGKDLRLWQPLRHLPTGWYPWIVHISHSSLYLRRTELVENRLVFDSNLRYTGDYDWIVRILQTGKPIGRMKKRLSMLRLHELQTTHTRFYAARRELFAVQEKLGVPGGLAAAFRKFMFVLKLVNAAKSRGAANAVGIVAERIRNRKNT